MRRFLKHLLLFCLPLLLVVALLFALLALSGEFCNLDMVASRMAEGEELVLELNYRTNATALLKSKLCRLRGAEVLVLGTSRTMQFGSEMFAADTDFYNAGGAVTFLRQMQPFLQSLPEDKLPRILIIGLDQYFFNAEWDNSTSPDTEYFAGNDSIDPADSMVLFLHHCGEGKINPFALATAPNTVFGVPARVRGSGFKSDGSYLYGTQAADAVVDLTFSDSLQRIAAGSNRFQYGTLPSDGALNILDSLLSWCRAHDIMVIGYLPPYAPSVWQTMLESGNYGYMQALPTAAATIFEKYGMECYDFTNMADTSDEEFIDGFHGGDRVYCKMLLHMLESGSVLTDYTSADILQSRLACGGNARVIE